MLTEMNRSSEVTPQKTLLSRVCPLLSRRNFLRLGLSCALHKLEGDTLYTVPLISPFITRNILSPRTDLLAS